MTPTFLPNPRHYTPAEFRALLMAGANYPFG